MTEHAISVVAPASYGQERIWLAAQLAPEAIYHVWGWVPLPTGADETVLRRALGIVAGRHEALRTRLELRNGELHQVVLKQVEPEIHVRTAPTATREEVILGRAMPEGGLPVDPFDVTRAPLWRSVIVHCSDGDVALVLAHHAVFDAASHGIVERELTTLLADPSARLDPVTPQPADVASWQRGQARDGALDEGIAHWHKQLDGSPGLHGLPLDGQRSETSGQPGDDLFFRLPDGTSERAIALGRSLGATEFMVAFAAYAAFVHRVSGDDDVVVGVPVSDRDISGSHSAVGMFVNTVVLRLRLDDDPTFVDLVRRAKEQLLGAWEHAGVPLQLVAERVPYERIPGAAPIYQLGFNHLGRTGLGRAFGHAKDEFFMELSDDDGRVEYRTDLFERSTAVRLAGLYGEVFAGLVADPENPVSALALDDRGAAGWETVQPAHPPIPVTDALERLGERGDLPALTYEGETLTYAQLDDRSRSIAADLADQGVRRGDTVAVISSRSAASVPAVVGVLRAGAVYLPIDPELPAARRDVMAERADVRLVLDVDRQHAQLTGDCPKGPAPSRELTLDDAAYVLFTSGSTGEPKGVINTHGGLAQRLAWMQDTYAAGPGEVIMHKTPASFDVSVWELLWPVLHGARTVVAPPDAHRDPAAIAALAVREGVTFLHFVPSMLRAFLAAGARLPRTVRQIVCSGEALDTELVQQVRATHPWIAVDNLYGPTEAAIDVSRQVADDDGPRQVPLGLPVPGTALRVLDARLRRQPVGVSGQLFIAGAQVARGYADRAGQTARSFVPDPYGPPGARMYATGDLALWASDGTLRYLGRNDDQVKVRGQRVELDEVTAAILAVDGVDGAAVAVRTDAAGDTALIAVVTGSASAEEITRAAGRRLPAGMVPSTIRAVEQIPVTRHGKVDRAAILAMPDEPSTRSARAATPKEQLVGEVLGAALDGEPLGPDDNFFTLGGHSLAAIRALTTLRGRTGADLAVSALFTHPTPAELATLLPDAASSATSAAGPVFAPRATTRVSDLDDDEVERALRAALARKG